MKRLLLVCNGVASSADQPLDHALSVIRDIGIDVDVQRPADVEAMGSLIRANAERVDAVLVAGGDGTVNAALRPVLDTGLPLGVLPMGTANDFARTLGIPTDLESACGIVAAQGQRRIDVAWANDKPFVNAAGIGMSTRLPTSLSRETKKRLGPLSYPTAVARTLRDFRSFRATLTLADGLRHIRSIQITVGNGVYYGGGTPIAEDSAIDDGRLDLYSVHPAPFTRLAAVAVAVRTGTQSRLPAGVLTASGVEFEIATRSPMAVSLDGEILLETPVRFRVDPGRLTVLAPAED